VCSGRGAGQGRACPHAPKWCLRRRRGGLCVQGPCGHCPPRCRAVRLLNCLFVNSQRAAPPARRSTLARILPGEGRGGRGPRSSYMRGCRIHVAAAAPPCSPSGYASVDALPHLLRAHLHGRGPRRPLARQSRTALAALARRKGGTRAPPSQIPLRCTATPIPSTACPSRTSSLPSTSCTASAA
jgi:hypothetical protein